MALSLFAPAAQAAQDIDPASEAAVSIPVEINGVVSVVHLQPDSIRSATFELFVETPNGRLISMPPPSPNTLSGEVDGVDGSSVSAIRRNGQIELILSLTSNEPSLVAVHEEGSLQPSIASPMPAEELMCGAVSTDPIVVPGNGTGASTDGTAPRRFSVLIDSDYQLYLDNSSSIEATLDDIESVVHGAALKYNPANVRLSLDGVIIRSTPGFYPSNVSSQTMLDFLRNQFGYVGSRVLHLFTGQEFTDHPVVGRASLGTFCLGQPRGVNSLEASSPSILFAHELGHNFGLDHCNGSPAGCGIMRSSILANSNFTQPELNAIRQRTEVFGFCATDVGPALSLPVVDQTPSVGAIDPSVWEPALYTEVAPNGRLAIGRPDNSSGIPTSPMVTTRTIDMSGVTSALCASISPTMTGISGR